MESLPDSDPSDRKVTIKALRSKTKALISALLNPVMVIPNDNGVLRYWRGLAGLCKIRADYEASIEESSDPTSKVLELWYERDREGSTIHQFLLFLEEMDRYDVVEDISELIDEDIKVYNEAPVEIRQPNLEADKYILTRGDVARISEGLPLETYDAFVLYDQDDIEFATELLDTMEKKYEMKLCVRDRDLVGGGLELDKMIKLITERCNRLIVILSDAFFKSSANQYYLSFAHAYGIESQRKIIPCVYKECTLPSDMKFLFILDYRRMAVFNFWGRLKDTIVVANNDKFALNRSKSDNSEGLRSVLHETYSAGLKPINQGVKFSNSVGDFSSLETKPDPSLNSSTSADNLAPFPQNSKKEKKPNWFKKILTKGTLRRDQSKAKNEVVDVEKEKRKVFSFNRHIKRRAEAIAN